MKRDRGFFVSAVIVAAGKGTRMKMDTNKQYIEIAGKPIIARTLQVFEACTSIDEIILVVNSDDILYCKKNIVDNYSFRKLKIVVAGGDERQQSVLNGLKEVNSNCEIVLIHDGARPFVTQEILIESINNARNFDAACVGVPVKDTIKSSDSGGNILETFNRSNIWSIQTPQTFKYNLILDAHEKAVQEGFKGTDDSVLVEHLGAKVKLVMGSYNNIKITTQEDLAWGEALVAITQQLHN